MLEREDIEPAIESFKEHLASKNVAADVADNICESVATRVEGKKLPSLTRVSTVVYEALEVAVTRLLTPNRDVGPLSASCCMGPKKGVLGVGAKRGGGGLGCIDGCPRLLMVAVVVFDRVCTQVQLAIPPPIFTTFFTTTTQQQQ